MMSLRVPMTDGRAVPHFATDPNPMLSHKGLTIDANPGLHYRAQVLGKKNHALGCLRWSETSCPLPTPKPYGFKPIINRSV